MTITSTLNWETISEKGLPIIDSDNISVLFIHDQVVYEGWHADNDYYIEMKEEIPPDNGRHWETVDGNTFKGGVEYWSYIPKSMKKLLEWL